VGCSWARWEGVTTIASNRCADHSDAVAHESGNGDLGRLTWSAFTCATYAEIANKTSKQARLFELAVNSGRKFLEGLDNGTITPDDRREAPTGVLMMMQGAPALISFSEEFLSTRRMRRTSPTHPNGLQMKGSKL
jgi:hypothetical protein